MLIELSSHYWRPDFSPGQYRSLLNDFISDLAEYDLPAIEAAIFSYRRNPENRFFPHPGALIGIIHGANKPMRRAIEAYKAPPDHPDYHKPKRSVAEILAARGK